MDYRTRKPTPAATRPARRARLGSGLSPAATRGLVVLAVIAVLAGLAYGVKVAVDAKRPKGTDDEQIRRMLYEGEQAAERRDAAGVSRYMSNDYDDGTFRAAQIRYQIGQWFRDNSSVDVEIPSETIETEIDPGGQTARVQFRMTVGRRGVNGNSGAEMEVVLRLKKDPVYYFGVFPGREWRVVSAGGWQAILD